MIKQYVYIGAVIAALGLGVAGIHAVKGCKQTVVQIEAEQTKQDAIANPAKTTQEVIVNEIRRVEKPDGTVETIERITTGKVETTEPRVPTNIVVSQGSRIYLTVCGGLDLSKRQAFSFGGGIGYFITDNIGVGIRYDQMGGAHRFGVEATIKF